MSNFVKFIQSSVKNTRNWSISYALSSELKMTCYSVNLQITKWSLEMLDKEQWCFVWPHAFAYLGPCCVSGQHWQLFWTWSSFFFLAGFYPAVRWHQFQLDRRALGEDFSYSQWKWLSDCAFTFVCQIRFASQRENETRVSLDESRWKTNHKWDVGCWRLCWHFLSYYVEFKGFGVFNHCSGFWKIE